MRVSHLAERNVGEQFVATAACQIFLGHAGHCEARRHGKGEDVLQRIAARDGFRQRDHAALGSGVVPVRRAVAAMAGAAGDVDDALVDGRIACGDSVGSTCLLKMQNCMAAQVGGGLQVDGVAACPGVGKGIGVGNIGSFEDAGIVDQNIDAPTARSEGLFPKRIGGARHGKIGGDEPVITRSRLPDDVMPGGDKRAAGGSADATGSTGEKDCGHPPALARPLPRCNSERGKFPKMPDFLQCEPVCRVTVAPENVDLSTLSGA